MAVLSRVSAEGTTGKVVFHTPAGVGCVWLRNGHLVDAELGRLTGERALLRVLSYGTSRWLEQPGAQVERQRLHASLPELVRKVEARQRQWAELLPRVPPLSAVLQLGDSGARFDGARGKICTLIDGRRPLFAVLDESGLDPVAALSSIVQLLEAGALRLPASTADRTDQVAPSEADGIDTLFDALQPRSVVAAPREPSRAPRARAPSAPVDDVPGAESEPPEETAEAPPAGAPPSRAIVPFRRPAVDRYEILGRIARGGMATVYLCRLRGEGGFSRRFALKVLRRHLCHNPDAVRLLLREARLTGRLHHPNVVSVVDVGSNRGQPYLVMEYVPGCSVAELLAAQERGELTVSAAVAAVIGVEALAGLHAAHTLGDERGRPLGLVHQDVSPENLLVGLDGVTRVTDFGVAHVSDALDPGVQDRGKPQYLAPERITGEAVDHRADVFAMGAVLFRLLTGLDLFDGESAEEVMHQVLSKPVPPPSTVGRQPPRAFDPICLRALQRVPARRYQSAEHFRADLLRAAVLVDQMALASEVAEAARRAVEAVRGSLDAAARGDVPDVSELEGSTRAAVPGARAIVLSRSRQAPRRETQELARPSDKQPLPSWVVAAFLVLCLLLALLLDVLSDSGPEPPSLERGLRHRPPGSKPPEIRIELEPKDEPFLEPKDDLDEP